MTEKKFKPMLAHSETPDLSQIKYPKLISPKLDGFRCIMKGGVALSRKLLPIPNLHVQKLLSGLPDGPDGELIVGDPTHPEVFSNTAKGVGKVGGEPDFTFWVFDDCSLPEAPFVNRHKLAIKKVLELDLAYVKVVEHKGVHGASEVRMYADGKFADGYEGAILRDPTGPYKYGRSTLKEEWMLKVKFWQDSEAEILSVAEQQTNLNEATVDELGHTKRSTAKAGKVGAGTLGACMVRWFNGKEFVEFSLAAGGTLEEVAQLWAIKDQLPGQIVTFKYNGIGVNGRPRFPIWKSVRPKFDCEVTGDV